MTPNTVTTEPLAPGELQGASSNPTGPITILAYAQADNENIFLLSGAVDEQCTLDSTTNLLGGWSTGPELDFLYGDGTLEVIQPLGNNPPGTQFYRCTVVP